MSSLSHTISISHCLFVCLLVHLSVMVSIERPRIKNENRILIFFIIIIMPTRSRFCGFVVVCLFDCGYCGYIISIQFRFYFFLFIYFWFFFFGSLWEEEKKVMSGIATWRQWNQKMKTSLMPAAYERPQWQVCCCWIEEWKYFFFIFFLLIIIESNEPHSIHWW